ncbi:MAG: NADH-quinone oxidoreductase subunit B, partial [Candidatus Omnitrophica bacterium]|nr:NADH-quinone oxidoreductase subunit B [Candidatus Omnitrophota bacterium]
MTPPKILFRPTEEQVLEQEVRRHVAVLPWDKLITLIDPIYNWGRRNSIWPLQFGLACCAIEMICTAASRFDIARFGAELFRASPRQADLMIVSGTVTKKMVPMIVRLYNQMPEPKYVISMGACATAGGPFKEGYNVVSGIDKFLPVDVYIPGCPPTPQALLHALITLQKKIDQQSVRQVRWYRKEVEAEIPVPLLGPDLVDLRRAQEIKAICAAEAPPKPAAAPTFIPAPTRAPAEARVIEPGDLQRVARELKLQPDLALDYLSNLTCVDYQDCYEVVYHLYSTKRPLPAASAKGSLTTAPGPAVTLKVRADKGNPHVPSVSSIWPGADFQEREVWDLYGVRFDGHPNLKRILMWEGFEGHPMRRDYLEPYYEAPGKLFPSRWKEGRHQRAEERVRFADNVSYPAGFDPTQGQSPPQDRRAAPQGTVPAEEMTPVTS